VIEAALANAGARPSPAPPRTQVRRTSSIKEEEGEIANVRLVATSSLMEEVAAKRSELVRMTGATMPGLATYPPPPTIISRHPGEGRDLDMKRAEPG